MSPRLFSLCLIIIGIVGIVIPIMDTFYVLASRISFSFTVTYTFRLSEMGSPADSTTFQYTRFRPIPNSVHELAGYISHVGETCNEVSIPHTTADGKIYSNAYFFFLLAKHWKSGKTEIFGRDGGQTQDPRKLTKGDIDNHLENLSDDDKKYLKDAIKNKAVYLENLVHHEHIEVDLLRAVRAVVAEHPLARAYMMYIVAFGLSFIFLNGSVRAYRKSKWSCNFVTSYRKIGRAHV